MSFRYETQSCAASKKATGLATSRTYKLPDLHMLYCGRNSCEGFRIMPMRGSTLTKGKILCSHTQCHRQAVPQSVPATTVGCRRPTTSVPEQAPRGVPKRTTQRRLAPQATTTTIDSSLSSLVCATLVCCARLRLTRLRLRAINLRAINSESARIYRRLRRCLVPRPAINSTVSLLIHCF